MHLRRSPCHRAFPALLLAVFLAAGPASATTLLPVTLERVTEMAPLVVAGTVVATEGRWDEEKGIICTHATVEIEEIMRGAALPAVAADWTVEVVVPGGISGEDWTRIPGAPEVGEVGQRVVAFLYGQRGGYYSNIVYWQGLYHLDGDRVRETGENAAVFLERVRHLVLAHPLTDGGPDPALDSGEEVIR